MFLMLLELLHLSYTLITFDSRVGRQTLLQIWTKREVPGTGYGVQKAIFGFSLMVPEHNQVCVVMKLLYLYKVQNIHSLESRVRKGPWNMKPHSHDILTSHLDRHLYLTINFSDSTIYHWGNIDTVSPPNGSCHAARMGDVVAEKDSDFYCYYYFLNEVSESEFADPPYCDHHKWPSCLRVTRWVNL